MSREALAIIAACVVIVAALGVALALLRLGRGPVFRYDRNPYRRFCPRCGQQQDNYCHGGTWAAGWWEPQGAIMDPDCTCHEAVPEQFRPKVWMDADDLARSRQRRDARKAEAAPC